MIKAGWRVHYVPAELPEPVAPMSFVAGLPGDWAGWLRAADVLPGTPFLVSPSYEYDVALNAFFGSVEMMCLARATQVGYARDLAAFLNFLWSARGGRSWRDAVEADHTAYLVWRHRDEVGPRVDAATCDREIAAVNRFYRWQLSAGAVRSNPIPQRWRRLAPAEAGRGEVGAGAQTPATYSHAASRAKIEWFPAASYRRWRDVGMRGYNPAGLPDPTFRGRWAGRNAVFCDLMVRTGLRLAEQAALTVMEVPAGRRSGGYQRFWLPPAIAKGESARWIYVPASVVAELVTYVEVDRAAVIAEARAAGRYERLRRPLVIEDPDRLMAVSRRDGSGHRIKVASLNQQERRRLLVDTPQGLEPAAFWLSEAGLPMAVSTWKSLFGQANARCRALGVELHGHPHLLRHTFAVITLEQLQRGHLAALAGLTPEQRGHYTRVFGDPLDWVRRRLGHRSVVTTQTYLHALAELELHTRMALVPDGWEDPRDTLAEDTAGPAELIG